jgi:hypothetical protein
MVGKDRRQTSCWLPEYQMSFCLNIKMGKNFWRKAQLVAKEDNQTEAPPTLTYSFVVSCDSVCISFLVAALNDLQLLDCDI